MGIARGVKTTSTVIAHPSLVDLVVNLVVAAGVIAVRITLWVLRLIAAELRFEWQGQCSRRTGLTRNDLRTDAERAHWDRVYAVALSQAHYSNRR
jgi:hypothetical protein